MDEATQRNQPEIEKGNETLIAQMLRDAQKTNVPTELDKNPVVHAGDGTLPAPMVATKISNAGYVWIWDTRTHEKMPCLYYMLAQKLRERRKDGSYRFTTNDSGELPERGRIKCMLHPDSPSRKEYDALGFRTCTKSNITNEYQLKRHMMLKHPQEWSALEEARKERERQEDRALQQLLLASQVKDEPKREEPTEDEVVEPTAEREPLAGEYICGKCNGAIHRENSKIGRRHSKHRITK